MESRDSIKEIEEHRSDPLELRVFRLETTVIEMAKTEGELVDKLKNAHHRIDESNRNIVELRTELKNLSTKMDNLGINLAKKDDRDKKWRRWLVVIGVLAVAAFVGMFIQDSEIRKGIGEIALKVGIGAASVI